MMRRKLALVLALPLLSAIAACDHDPAPIAGQGWVEVWEDTFDYPSVAAMGDVWELNGNVTLATNPNDPDDQMVRLRTGPFQGWNWTLISTAGPRSASEPNYPDARAWQGPLYVEAYVRYTENRHTWPAFWMFSLHKIEAGPTDDCSSPPLPSELTAEWDIMENGWDSDDTSSHYFTDIHRNTMNAQIDWCGVPDTTNRYAQDFPGKVLGDWHLWAGYWRPDGQLCTYLDDALIRCAPAPDSFAQPLVVTFDIARIPEDWCNPGGCPPPPSELVMEVSNVRVLKPSP
jgi:hypothetical protein